MKGKKMFLIYISKAIQNKGHGFCPDPLPFSLITALGSYQIKLGPTAAGLSLGFGTG